MPWPTGKQAHNKIEPPTPGMRICKTCDETKVETDFYGKSHKCKVCTLKAKKETQCPVRKREENLGRYGITSEDYSEMLKQQNGGCAICGAPEPTHTRKKHLSVDHDHETGKVRGLLCDTCNRGLGLFGDNPNTIQSAINYLKKHK